MKKILSLCLFIIGLTLTGNLALAQNASSSACISLTANLGVGSRGTNVTQLQTFLHSEGYLALNPTGYFGNNTRLSVIAFQKAKGISPTGFVGPMTRAAIYTKACTTVTTDPVPSPQPTPAATPTHTPTPSPAPVTGNMTFGVGGVTPFSFKELPRTMSYSAGYAVSWGTIDPHDSATYSVDYGDGVKADMKFANVACPIEGGANSHCYANWTAPNHSFSTPGVYTAILYKNGVQIDSKKFIIYIADITTSPTAPNGVNGKAPLDVTFNFTGGTKVDFGDGTTQSLCSSNCSQWSNTYHQIHHTYAKGSYQMTVKFNDILMEGAEINAQ